jgi:hypothetical protein
MVSRPVAARQLALYADNPLRFCSLRDQLERPVGKQPAGGTDEPPGHDLTTAILALLCLIGLAVVFLPEGLRGVLFDAGSGFPGPGLAGGSTLIGGLMAVIAGLAWLRRSLPRRATELARSFELEPSDYRLLFASVLGNRPRPMQIDGVSAVPHVVFRKKSGHRTCHVGMMLSRKYAGKVQDADLFRLTLHMGIVRRSLGIIMMSGSIRYSDYVVRVPYSDSLYRSLMSLVDEYRRSTRRGWPVERRSLRQRQNRSAAKAARAAGTVAWPTINIRR